MKFFPRELVSGLKMEVVYLWLAIPIGLIFVFLNPPFAGVPDEGAHYFKSLNLAQGQMTCAEQASAPENYASLPDNTVLVKIKGEERKKVSGKKLLRELTTPMSENLVPIPPYICGASPLGHITQTLGLKLGLLTNAPPLVAFYLGRLLTLVAAVSFIYLAIRIVPFGKIVFLVAGLLPSVVQQLSSFSYDAPHIGLILLFTAYALKLATDSEALTVKQGWLFLVLSLLALNVKPGYSVLCLLVFLLPKVKFQNVKKYWAYIAGYIVANLLFFVLLRVAFNETVRFPEGADPFAQIWVVLKNPINFVFVVFESFYGNFFFYFETFFLKPGWLNTGLPDLLYVFMAVGMVLILRSKDEIVSLSTRQRFVLLAVFIAQFFLVFLSMYLVWTKVGGTRVVGVQGRYFLAVMPLLIFSLYKSKFRFRSEWIKDNLAVALIVFFLITFIFTLQNIFELYYKNLSSYF